MPVDFLSGACQEPVIQAVEFGLCDDQNGTHAYTDTTRPDRWIATVHNRQARELVFTAVDKCLLQDTDEPGRGRCDAMLTSPEHLYFIELKDEARGWVTGAIDQLESTIRFFLASHDTSRYRHKKAFACNRRHGHFQEIDNERNLRFFRQYGFRLDVQAVVVVVEAPA